MVRKLKCLFVRSVIKCVVKVERLWLLVNFKGKDLVSKVVYSLLLVFIDIK